MGTVGHSAECLEMEGGPGGYVSLEIVAGLGRAVYFITFTCLLLHLYVQPDGKVIM